MAFAPWKSTGAKGWVPHPLLESCLFSHTPLSLFSLSAVLLNLRTVLRHSWLFRVSGSKERSSPRFPCLLALVFWMPQDMGCGQEAGWRQTLCWPFPCTGHQTPQCLTHSDPCLRTSHLCSQPGIRPACGRLLLIQATVLLRLLLGRLWS